MRAPITTIGSFLAVAFAGVLSLSADARAATNPKSCLNDIDCIATPECGGEVCPYDGAHPFTCQPAGTGKKGMDGWCTVDSDCKCASLGAKCIGGAYCSFTLAKDAPGAGTGGAAGTGGGSGTGGSSATGGAGGASATGGSKENDSSGGGGCSVAGTAAAPGSAALLALLGLLLRRDRRRA